MVAKKQAWLPAERRLLRELMAAGHSWESAAGVMGRSFSSVREQGRRLNIKSQAARKVELAPPPEVPVYDGALEIDADVGGGLVIVADVHAPATDWVMATRAALIGRRYLEPPRRLMIAGDFINCDAFSKYDSLVPLPSLDAERRAARFAMELWLQTFDEVYFTLGNHEYRWLRLMKGALEEGTTLDLLRAFISNDDRLTLSVYPYSLLHSRTGTWRLTHPTEFSRVPLSKARFIGYRHRGQHILLPHLHGHAVGLDESATQVLVEIPSMVDPQKLAYVSIADGSKPMMKRGFAALLNGTIHVFSDHPGLTDWERWLPEDKL